MFIRGFKSGKKVPIDAVETTILGEGSRWQGELTGGKGGLRVEGELEGALTMEGPVRVEAAGQVKGTLQVRNLQVTGRVDGEVHVAERLEILRGGWVEGEVEIGTLVVDEGGMLQGNCARLPTKSVKEPVPLVPRSKEPLKPEPQSGSHLEAINSHGSVRERPNWPTDRRRF